MYLPNTKYRGQFLCQARSAAGLNTRVATVEIAVEGYTGAASELTFPHDTPVLIEWAEWQPETPVQGSTATVKVISPGDRTFADLYTVRDGAVAVAINVEHLGTWYGTLDPEVYEEPYSTAAGYEVTLTFSDLAPLARKDYDGCNTGYYESVLDIVSAAMSRVAWNKLTIDTSRAGINPDNHCIAAANWIDEDNNPARWHDVVTEALKPNALYLVQRAGRVWLYDLETIQQQTGTPIYWTDTNSVMSVAPVAEKITLTFSPYAVPAIGNGNIDDTKLFRDIPVSSRRAIRLDYQDSSPTGYRMYWATPEATDIGNPALTISREATTDQLRIFRCWPGFSGQATAGVIVRASDWQPPRQDPPGNALQGTAWDPVRDVSKATQHQQLAGTPDYSMYDTRGYTKVMTVVTPPICRPGNVVDTCLKISLDLLLDVRFNPYEAEGLYNCEGAFKRMQNRMNFTYVPVILEALDANGSTIYHYRNRNTIAADNQLIEPPTSGTYVPSEVTAGTAARAVDGWVKTTQGHRADMWGEMWLAYYDPQDRKTKSGLGGWQTNRQSIGYYRDALPTAYDKRGTGEYIPLPPETCTLRLTIGRGIHSFDYKRDRSWQPELYDEICWLAWRNPSIEVTRWDGGPVDTDDIIYTAQAMDGAAGALDIATRVGSSVFDSAACSRGHMLYTGSNNGARSLEPYYIQTLFSCYGNRRTILSGTCGDTDTAAGIYTDPAQPTGTKFLITSAAINLRAGTMDATFTQLHPIDTWTPVTKS